MHLGLMVPNTWYRARLIYTDPELGLQDIVGVTMPGAPAVVAGSNRRLAWALTASCLDTTDLVKLELDPANPRRYRAPSGWQELQQFAETIHVQGGTNVELTVDETIWGPVVKRGKKQFALACTLHDPQAINLRSVELERARDTETVLRISGLAGTPVLNLIVGDAAGNIGYSVLGRLPNRVGFDGSTPSSWADGTRGWQGWVPAEDYPRLVNPTNGILWTANNRTLGSPAYNRLHIANADNGARAGQIRDDLLALDKPTEQTLWSIYHDDRALFLDRWQKLMLSVLAKGSPGKPAWQEAKDLVASWGGRAAVNSQGYRLVRGFRAFALNLLFQPVNERLGQYDQGMRFSNEEAAWALLSARPPHLLNPAFPTYDGLLEKAVELLLADLKGRGIPLSQATWGSRNHLGIRHPLSQAVPQLSKWLGRWLDMADVQVSGDSQMPKVHGEGFGVSERMIVSPGHEQNGLYNMPCGQSGHFLSPFYRSEMEQWLKVEPQPLLPGPKAYQLELRPAR
jgi:penicillin amidase